MVQIDKINTRSIVSRIWGIRNATLCSEQDISPHPSSSQAFHQTLCGRYAPESSQPPLTSLANLPPLIKHQIGLIIVQYIL